MKSVINMTLIDNGFYRISTADARWLAAREPLPLPGKERLVYYDGQHWWLGRTPLGGAQVWAIRRAPGWRIVNGVAVLGSTPAPSPTQTKTKRSP